MKRGKVPDGLTDEQAAAYRSARTGAGREAAVRGKSLMARLPAWEGRYPRRPALVPVRGVQPGRCCRCGGPGRVSQFKDYAEHSGNSLPRIPRAMDWCGKGTCKEGSAPLPAMPGPVAVWWAWEGAQWLVEEAEVADLPTEAPANEAEADEAA